MLQQVSLFSPLWAAVNIFGAAGERELVWVCTGKDKKERLIELA